MREKFKHVKPLKDIPVAQRGWTLDVLDIVRRLCGAGMSRCGLRTSQRDVPAKAFTNEVVYAF